MSDLTGKQVEMEMHSPEVLRIHHWVRQNQDSVHPWRYFDLQMGLQFGTWVVLGSYQRKDPKVVAIDKIVVAAVSVAPFVGRCQDPNSDWTKLHICR